MRSTRANVRTITPAGKGGAATVFVIDDDEPVRESLRFLIESVDLPVETYASAREFLDRYNPTATGCILLDVRMPGISGLELQERLMAAGGTLPIIFISGHGDIEMAVRTIKAGAMDFVEKPFGDQDLLERIYKAIERSESNLARRKGELDLMARLSKLTGREREVLGLVGRGYANKMIATALALSEKTIEAHRAHMNRKLGTNSVADLVRMAMTAEGLSAGPHPASPAAHPQVD